MDYIWVQREQGQCYLVWFIALNLIYFTCLVDVVACKWYKLAYKIQINFQKYLIPFNRIIFVSTAFLILPLHI